MGLQDLNAELHGRELHRARMSEHTVYDPTTPGNQANGKRQAFESAGEWQTTNRPSGDVVFMQQ